MAKELCKKDQEWSAEVLTEHQTRASTMLKRLKEALLECEDSEGLNGKPAEVAVRKCFLQSVAVVKDTWNLVKRIKAVELQEEHARRWPVGTPLEKSTEIR